MIIKLKKGDNLIEKLTRIIDENKIDAGYILGLGALSEAELMLYDLDKKEYLSKKIQGPIEIGNFFSIISKDPEGKTHLHPHIVISNVDFISYSGHLKQGVVGATFEAVICPVDQKVERYFDSEIGLNLIK